MGIINIKQPLFCARIRRRILKTEFGLQALTPEREDIERHVRDCASCRAFLAEHRDWQALGSALRRANKGKTPLGVRQRLFRNLALARIGIPSASKRRRALLPVVALSALAMVVAAWVIVFMSPHNAGNGGEASLSIVEDHWRELHRAVVKSHDAATIQDWLSKRLSIPVHVMEFEETTLEGARLCFVNRRAGAVIIYRLEDELVSYFVMPAGSPAEQEAEARALQHHAEQGYNVITWQASGLQHALVSALPSERLRPLADACRKRAAINPGAADVHT